METRLIIAYAIITMLLMALAYFTYWVIRKRREERALRRGHSDYSKLRRQR